MRFFSTAWPARPAHFRDAWEAYYEAMVKLSENLMNFFAAALRVDPAYFASRIDRHLSALRGLNYPALDSEPQPGQLRAGAHSDYGTLTILLPGPGDGGLDMMQLWTNDGWVSTLHRVAVPNRGDVWKRTGKIRQSMAFFHQPNWDAEISTLPHCISAEHPQQYEPVTAGP